MKYILVPLFALFNFNLVFGQFPNGFNYQTVARAIDGTIITNTEIKMRISILQSELTGNPVSVEIFTAKSNPYGLLNLIIGSEDTASFEQIDWGRGPYFLKVEMDENGGSNFRFIGTSQLLSVPYALHAKTAESTKENDPLFNTWDKSSGILINEDQIIDLKHFKNSDETDSVFLSSVAARIKNSDIANWNNKSEVDPIFNNSIAKSISQNDISRWNNKSDFDGKYSSLSGLPTFHKIAFSGNYNDLLNAPANIISLSQTPLKGDILYFNGENWVTLAIGKVGQVLIINSSGLPFWK
jgi:hypothetical protein